MNMMELDGYKASIAYDPELELFRGEVLSLNGGANFYGRTPAELKSEFKNSLPVFLDVCQDQGIEPLKSFSGKLNVRIPQELHEQASTL